MDGWATWNTEGELATKLLMDANCPQLTMTLGDEDASCRGTQTGGEVHDTLAVSDGNTIVISGGTDYVQKVDLNDMTIPRRKVPQMQDSVETGGVLY